MDINTGELAVALKRTTDLLVTLQSLLGPAVAPEAQEAPERPKDLVLLDRIMQKYEELGMVRQARLSQAASQEYERILGELDRQLAMEMSEADGDDTTEPKTDAG